MLLGKLGKTRFDWVQLGRTWERRHLGIGQFAVLETGHVAAQAELFAVQPLQVLLPGRDLGADLAPALRLRHHRQLQLGHVLQLVVLEKVHTENKKTKTIHPLSSSLET